MNMDTITSQPFLTTVSALLVIGLIRVLKQLASEKRHRLKGLESLDDEEDDEYDPETELGIGAYQKPIAFSQNEIVLNHLASGLMCDKEMAKKHNIKKLSAVISTLKKKGYVIDYVKVGSRKGYVFKN